MVKEAREEYGVAEARIIICKKLSSNDELMCTAYLIVMICQPCTSLEFEFGR